MHRPHTPTYKTSPEDGYGLTFETGISQGQRWVGHHGIMSSFGCQLLLFPEQEIACIVLLNRQPALATPIAFLLLEDALIPLDATRFYWSRGLIEFQLAPDGMVPALLAMNVYLFKRVKEL